MQQTQAQVDEVTEIMRMNVEKVLERDGMISALDERADALKEGAEMFEKQAGALKSKFWYENLKMLIIMGIVSLLFILVFFVWVSSTYKLQGIKIAQPMANHFSLSSAAKLNARLGARRRQSAK